MQSIFSIILNLTRGEAHLVAKPQKPAKSRFTHEGIKEDGLEKGAVVAEAGEGGETQGNEAAPPPPQRQDQRQERHETTLVTVC